MSRDIRKAAAIQNLKRKFREPANWDTTSSKKKRYIGSSDFSGHIDRCVQSIKLPSFLEAKSLQLKSQIRKILQAECLRQECALSEWYLIRDQEKVHLVDETPLPVVETNVKVSQIFYFQTYLKIR